MITPKGGDADPQSRCFEQGLNMPRVNLMTKVNGFPLSLKSIYLQTYIAYRAIHISKYD